MKMRAVAALSGFAKTAAPALVKALFHAATRPSNACGRAGWGAADGRNHGWHRRPCNIKTGANPEVKNSISRSFH
jgi:hypothetical protein